MTSITWASPRYVQELATILGRQIRTQGSCGMWHDQKASLIIPNIHSLGWDILKNSTLPQFITHKKADDVFQLLEVA